MRGRIVAGSRRSRLALIQTASVVEAIKKANPGLDDKKLIVGKKIFIPAPTP